MSIKTCTNEDTPNHQKIIESIRKIETRSKP